MQDAPASIAFDGVDVERPPARRLPWARQPAAVAIALGALGTLSRLLLIVSGYPKADSDEATIGLAALHVAAGQDFPVWFYGQHYMGTVEAYLAAPLLVVAHPSVLLLRLPLILLYAGFLVAMYRLVAAAYSAWFGVLVIAVLALGSDRVLKDQLIAHGGTAEVKTGAALLLLLAYSLAVGWRRGRALGFFVWGLIAGLCFWDHLVILPYLAVAAGVLVVCRTRELVGRLGAYLVAGFLLGAAPLITYNVIATPGQDSLSIFMRQNDGPVVTLAQRLTGGTLLGVPLSTGVCEPGYCRPWQSALAPVIIALLTASAALAVRALRRVWSPQPARTRQLVRLALALGALLSIAAYTRSPAAGLTPLESARYLCCLPVSVPAMLWPLWRLGAAASAGVRVGARAALAALVVAVAAATVSVVVSAVPDARADAREHRQLLAVLQADGVQHYYSGYWTCNRLSFASNETVTCAALEDDLRPGYDRYKPYRAAVAADSRPAYVFVSGSPTDLRWRAHLRESGLSDAPTRPVGRYHLYLPPARVDLP